MFRILVADDEALERAALKQTLERQYPGESTVAAAVNGQEAIALAERLRIDIAVMDIEMPGINGLEAARIIKQLLPRCRIIILTAYQRFQYAQEAIAIGADDYLLKPVSDQDLIQKIDEAMAGVMQDRTNLDRSRHLDQLAKEQFVLSVISGYSNEASLRHQLKDLNIPFTYGYFMVLKGETAHSAEQLAEMTAPLLSLYEKGNLLTYEYDETLLIAVLMDDPYRGAEWILHKAAQLIQQVAETRHVRLLLGIGDAVSTPAELRASYELADAALARAHAGQPVVMDDGRPSAARAGLEERLYLMLLDKDLDGALRLVDIALDTLSFSASQPADAATAIERLLNGVLKRLKEDTRITDAGQADFAAFKQGGRPRMEWTTRIRTLLIGWMKEAEAQQGPHINAVKQEIERYLQRHYSDDLSIGRAARDMHYSEPYFSKLFARCFQRNFLTYLTELRLKAAVELLADPDTSIREIGVAVGYADANYFAKVFKKAYGLSPSDYRRKQVTQKDGEA